MPLFRKHTDDDEIERMEQQSKKYLNRYFDLGEGQADFPENASLVREDNIHATGFQSLDNGRGRIELGYRYNMSIAIDERWRVNFDVHCIGSMLCEGIVSVIPIPGISKSSIKRGGLFNRGKFIQFPINDNRAMKIVCRKLIIEKVGRFVNKAGAMVPLVDEIESIRNQLQNEDVINELKRSTASKRD